jgi:hypothetical protein
MLKFYITNIKQGIVLGCYVGESFFSHLIIILFCNMHIIKSS